MLSDPGPVSRYASKSPPGSVFEFLHREIGWSARGYIADAKALLGRRGIRQYYFLPRWVPRLESSSELPMIHANQTRINYVNAPCAMGNPQAGSTCRF